MFGSSPVGQIEYDSRITTDKLRKDAKDVESIARKTSTDLGDHIDHGTGRAGAAFSKFAKIAAGALAAIGVTQFAKSTVQAFTESENAIAQTEAVLKSTNSVAKVTAKTVTDLANSLQRETRYSDETIRSAENMLLTFTNISNKTFPGATQAVLDMATAMGSDLQSTAIQVGKALQDPVLGATALQRVGVRLTQSQKDLIEKLVKTGDAAGAQAVILKELQTEFGGSAKAAGQTFAGRLDILKNQLGEVQEAIGEVMVRGIGPIVGKFLQWYDAAGGVEGIMASLKGTVDKIMPTLKQWAGNIAEVARQVADYLQPKLTALWNTVETKVIPLLTRLWKEVIEPLAPVVGTVLVVALGLAIDALNALLTIVSSVTGFLIENKDAVIALGIALSPLAAAFIATKVAMGFSAVVSGLSTVFGTLTTVIGGTTTALGALSAVSIAGWVALIVADLYLIIKAANAVKGAFDALNNAKIAQAGLESSNAIVRSNLQSLAANGTPEQKARANAALASGVGLAQGTNYWRGGATWVGEEGPEIVNLPRGSQVIPNHELDSVSKASSNVSVTVHMDGILARSRSDLRDIATDLIQSVNEALRAKQQPEIGGGML